MRAIGLVITGVFLVVLNACTDDQRIDPQEADSLIFGHFYGECDGEGCVEIFKLTQSELFEDKKDIYPYGKDFYKGDFKSLSQQQFDSTKDLVGYFPVDLLNETNTIIGQPDAGDWGGLYIEYNHKGIRRFWLLDQMKSNVPIKYHDFINKVNEKIRQLR